VTQRQATAILSHIVMYKTSTQGDN